MIWGFNLRGVFKAVFQFKNMSKKKGVGQKVPKGHFPTHTENCQIFYSACKDNMTVSVIRLKVSLLSLLSYTLACFNLSRVGNRALSQGTWYSATS